MFVLFLCFLASQAVSQVLETDEVIINITTTSTTTLWDDLAHPDTCRSLVAMNRQLYHSDTTGLFEAFLIGNLSQRTFNRGTTTYKPYLFAVSQSET